MTQRLCKMCRDWHRLDEWPAECIQKQESKAASLPVPMLNSDALSKPLQSMATGNWHDSKSAMRREYREKGFVEIGNEKIRQRPEQKDSRAAVVRAAKQAGLIG